ncbi:hypothetical protein QBC46DRAFT_386136 [Diplogelasinospora grovesii]|uniref:MARVEL domain-containing protein n=1 Tax=Diplogelasinospora grovesii TaxID=303347 RepID=A0AAN6N6S3_9PEZI|nr:hypothetical protein QBC46DRAFT_386136 [Diplogelasinospora grovesii]
MARTRGTGLAPFHLGSNILIWISAVIVMGIVSYFLSLNNNQGSHIIYMEVVSVLTVAFYLAAFFLAAFAGYLMLFNLIFSYLWLVVVVFVAEDFTYSNSALLHTIEAFSFIAFFFLLFNVLHDWHFLGYRTTATTTSRV